MKALGSLRLQGKSLCVYILHYGLFQCRSELIRAYEVGTYSSLTAALILTITGNLVSGVMIALSIIALGGDATGSFVFGATMSIVGCFFAGIGALGVQLRESSGSARGIGSLSYIRYTKKHNNHYCFPITFRSTFYISFHC
ncbi:MAG: hypothetical protein PHT78_09105 [Desulfitobacteriaceae bacterium]|nr:hypothetical protein [Desulfitobacteriaceae bacterium]MDD4753387.1 hypothetical protein [Desulfitobacteriaceae bacterium]